MQKFKQYFINKKILIAGYGREGKSTLETLSSFVPPENICIADSNIKAFDNNIANSKVKQIYSGANYLSDADKFDIIIKTPGISMSSFSKDVLESGKITSQTEIFIQFFGDKIIGITGTKGKSTTTSMIYHILSQTNKKIILAGNIGFPVFNYINEDFPDYYVIELSSHQLENCKYSPHIAILLNIFPEHLDHYNSFDEYATAKWQIALHQTNNDYFITHDSVVEQYPEKIKKIKSSISIFTNQEDIDNSEYIFTNESIFKYSLNNKQTNIDFNNKLIPLKGLHNKFNIAAAYLACKKVGINDNEFTNSLYSFKALPHRMEYVGIFKGITFYNDSIATIPEACIAAVESISDIDTLIVGGFNRGIPYEKLIEYLGNCNISNIIVMGEVGQIIKNGLQKNGNGKKPKEIFEAKTMTEAVDFAFSHTQSNKTCLLSSAASSYDQFKNFEDRGDQYKAAINRIGNK